MDSARFLLPSARSRRRSRAAHSSAAALRPARTAAELRSFAGVYPNNNRFISNNLLTTETQQSGADLAAHDRQVLEIVNAWSAEPAFQPVKEHLLAMAARLNQFTKAPQSPDPSGP